MYKRQTESYLNEINLEILKSDKLIKKTMLLESLKLDNMLKVCKKNYKQNKKIVLLVNYTKSIEYIEENLRGYNYRTINGPVSSESRNEILNEFAEDSDKVKILVGNLSILSTGIDLDDKTGNYPRIALISPNLNGVTLFQAINRFNRIDTKSDADVFIYYLTFFGQTELDYLDLLKKKMNILENIIGKGVLENTKKIIISSPISRNYKSSISRDTSIFKTPSPIKIKKRNVFRRLQKGNNVNRVVRKQQIIKKSSESKRRSSLDEIQKMMEEML